MGDKLNEITEGSFLRVNKEGKAYWGQSESGGGGGGLFVVTVSADENGNIIADHYRDDIVTAFEKGETPIVKGIAADETQIFNLAAISNDTAMFVYVSLAGNPENADVFLQQCQIGKETVSISIRTIGKLGNP